MKVAVIKYNAGNIRSVDYALKRLGVEAVITSDKEALKAADKVIFPGVGEAETTMLHLKEVRRRAGRCFITGRVAWIVSLKNSVSRCWAFAWACN